MVKKADIPDHVIDTTLRLAAERQWREISLAEIAETAKLPIAKVHAVFPSRSAILDAFSRRTDAAVLAEAEPAGGEGSARDRLFDVIMLRFDALDPHKPAVGNLLYDQLRDPFGALCGAFRLRRSMALMLEAAGLSSGGPRGILRIKGLSLVYLSAMRVWLRDDSADKSRTMAELDRRLRTIETLILRLRRRPDGHAPEPGEGKARD
jgi:AcrR family transcriptional regulator